MLRLITPKECIHDCARTRKVNRCTDIVSIEEGLVFSAVPAGVGAGKIGKHDTGATRKCVLGPGIRVRDIHATLHSDPSSPPTPCPGPQGSGRERLARARSRRSAARTTMNPPAS